MRWDAELYTKRHQFVSEYGESLLNYVPECDAILDVGCGTGELTQKLCRKATYVRGVDRSEAMTQKAKEQFPNLDVIPEDILHYQDAHRYDVVFSNAVFHWIPQQDQPQLLTKIGQLLKKQGLLIAEFGGAYNIEAILNAFKCALRTKGVTSQLHFYFPDPRTYQQLLEQQGFTIKRLSHYYRPTPLQNGYHGLPTWLRQFFAQDLENFSEQEQEEIIQQTCRKVMPCLWNGATWVADYWRMQVIASRNTRN